MTDNDPSPAGGPACPHCDATTAAAKAEIGQVAKACIEQLGRVTDSVIGLIREVHAGEQVALHAWKAATEARTVTAGELRTELDGRDRIARCSLCTAPVLVHDDGSTSGGVDTLVGIRCDKCLNEPEDAAYAALAAAETEEDRGFHAAVRGRGRGGEDA
jgi:hypothetical protein